MAPEQWRGEAADERTDVYAVGLILFEMLTGHLPWPAADPRIAALAPQPAPPVRDVPIGLAQLIGGALSKDRVGRPRSALELLESLVQVERSLESARALRRSRLMRRGLVAAVPLLVGMGWGALQLVETMRLNRRITGLLSDADRVIAEARTGERTESAFRVRALSDFDRYSEDADAEWAVARLTGEEVDRAWARAGQILERAVVLDGSRSDISQRLGVVLLARALIAERDHRSKDRDELVERLATYGDAEAQSRWKTPARLSVESTPPGAIVTVHRYQGDGTKQVATIGTPIVDLELPPGSYLLVVASAGRPEVRFPLLLERGETFRTSIIVPSRVPPGFVYVPAGRFLYGSPDDTQIRLNLNAQPQHTVATEAYLIARYEVTFGD